MSIQISVVTGKQEEKKPTAGFLGRQEAEKEKEKESQTTLHLSELVSTIILELQNGLSQSTDVEIEVAGTIELKKEKDADPVLTYNIGSDAPGQRTLKLKLTTTVTPK